MHNHNYLPTEAIIIEKKRLFGETFSFRLKIKGSYRHVIIPGQFIMLSVLGFGEVPIAIISAFEKNNEIEIAVKSIGLVTKKICSLDKGDSVGISVPLGNGFPLSELKGKDVVIVAGGTGIFPLRSLITYLAQKNEIPRSVKIIIGARDEGSLAFKKDHSSWRRFAQLLLTIDKGKPSSRIEIGNAVEAMGKIKLKPGSLLMACGPQSMYNSIVKMYAGKSISDKDIYFMLERKMKCGVGKCQHCTCGSLYTCTDGPVFSYFQLKNNGEAFVE